MKNSYWVDIFKDFSKKKMKFKCRQCGKLLAYEKILLGTIEIKCPRCKTVNKLVFDDIEPIVKIITENS